MYWKYHTKSSTTPMQGIQSKVLTDWPRNIDNGRAPQTMSKPSINNSFSPVFVSASFPASSD